jgi:hypothetical protein
MNQDVPPDHVMEWHKVNSDVPIHKLRCPVCGEWYASIDHLAPYHWETCWCAKCQTYPRRPSDDAPRSNVKS